MPIPILFVSLLISLSTGQSKASTTLNTTTNNTSPQYGETKELVDPSDFVKLEYHMGPVLSSTIAVHPIWYGKWTPSQKRIIRSFIGSISNSSINGPSVSAWWSTVRLYTDQTGSNVSSTIILGKEKVDMYSHGKSLTRLSMQTIIENAISSPVKPLPVDPKGGLYLILTSPDVSVENFCSQVCGFHYFTFPSIVGYTLPYAWVGNSQNMCPDTCAFPFAVPSYRHDVKPEKAPNGDVGVDGMVIVIGHELSETATNPLINAWYAGDDPTFPNEISDLCLGVYGPGGGASYTGQMLRDKSTGAVYNANGVDGRKFLVQWVWDRYKNHCTGPNALGY